jgi:DNA-binding transcriptional ArsR family regulator
VEVTTGQIAHLDHDHSNNAPDNLAFLCLQHHAEYDSRSRQAKGLTIAEVKAYRKELHDAIAPLLERQQPKAPLAPAGVDPVASAMLEEQRDLIVEVLAERGVVRGISELARRSDATYATVERQLHELAQRGIVRIDRPKGSPRRAYSLVDSLENRLIDTFLATLGEPVTADNRYVRFAHDCMIDAYVETASGSKYIVELLVARDRLDTKAVKQRVRGIVSARRHLKAEAATGVLLISISAAMAQTTEDLRTLVDEGIRIQFVELS